MERRTVVILIFTGIFALAASGCYHATVETGLVPSTVVIEESFASCWIYGLVPPSTIAAQLKCTHGVAKVETEHSFLNQLVGVITLGIYTPISIKVTCAAAEKALLEQLPPDMMLDVNATQEQLQEALDLAARKAIETGRPVFLRY